MTELVNICAPADAPKGAPLLFDPDAPGHCRWGTAAAATAIERVEGTAPDKATLDRVTRLEMMVAQVAEHAKQLEADRLELLRICQLLDDRISSFSIDVKQVA